MCLLSTGEPVCERTQPTEPGRDIALRQPREIAERPQPESPKQPDELGLTEYVDRQVAQEGGGPARLDDQAVLLHRPASGLLGGECTVCDTDATVVDAETDKAFGDDGGRMWLTAVVAAHTARRQRTRTWSDDVDAGADGLDRAGGRFERSQVECLVVALHDELGTP